MKARLNAAILHEQPILSHDWIPEPVHAAYDITPVEEPARAKGRENVNLDKNGWLEASNCSCVGSDAIIRVANSRSLETAIPNRRISLPDET